MTILVPNNGESVALQLLVNKIAEAVLDVQARHPSLQVVVREAQARTRLQAAAAMRTRHSPAPAGPQHRARHQTWHLRSRPGHSQDR